MFSRISKAGLFSAILSAFLIEVRKGLHQDPQDVTNMLLRTVILQLQNATPLSIPCNDCFQPEAHDVAVNILWFCALTFSLVGALGAVLAKGWVAVYASYSNGTSASDACARQLRYNNIIAWQLPIVILSIPIFLHIALFLFFAGLVVLLLFDSAWIAYSTLAIIIIVTMLYVFITILPTVFPHSPFKTPLSDYICYSLFKLPLVRIFQSYCTATVVT